MDMARRGDLRAVLSTIEPIIKKIAMKHQPQDSHYKLCSYLNA